MSDNSYELRQILSELKKQTILLTEIRDGVKATESAVWDTAPQ